MVLSENTQLKGKHSLHFTVTKIVLGLSLIPFLLWGNAGALDAPAPSLLRLKKALHGVFHQKEVTLAAIGGSITKGAGASAMDHRWLHLTGQWWRNTFPEAQVKIVDAGIGSSNSLDGAHRAKYHLKQYQPDLIFVEFAVNDAGLPEADLAMEGLVRQLLNFEKQPAVILLFTTNALLQNNEAPHRRVGSYYRLPMIGMKTAFEDLMRADHIGLDQLRQIYFADAVHPNDKGHAFIAHTLNAYIETVLVKFMGQLKASKLLLPIPDRLPPPLTQTPFEHARLLIPEIIRPVLNFNFKHTGYFGELYGLNWTATQPNSCLDFDLVGTTIGLLYRETGAVGKAYVSLDQEKKIPVMPLIMGNAGSQEAHLLYRGLPSGKHRLVLMLSDTLPKDYTFTLLGILAGGLPKSFDDYLDQYRLTIPGNITVFH